MERLGGEGDPSATDVRRECTEADEVLFAELYPSLRRFAAVVRPPDVDPDDLVQEALARLLVADSLARCENPGAYLRRTILNLASNQRRSYSRWRNAMARTSASGSESALSVYPSDLGDLARLGAVDRAVLYLSIVDGLPYAEVGALLGMRATAVRARASRALRRLRVELKSELRRYPDA